LRESSWQKDLASLTCLGYRVKLIGSIALVGFLNGLALQVKAMRRLRDIRSGIFRVEPTRNNDNNLPFADPA